ncbi:hypothetical protein RFI_05135, partial [Reticulomyxa filosa]
ILRLRSAVDKRKMKKNVYVEWMSNQLQLLAQIVTASMSYRFIAFGLIDALLAQMMKVGSNADDERVSRGEYSRLCKSAIYCQMCDIIWQSAVNTRWAKWFALQNSINPQIVPIQAQKFICDRANTSCTTMI